MAVTINPAQERELSERHRRIATAQREWASRHIVATVPITDYWMMRQDRETGRYYPEKQVIAIAITQPPPEDSPFYEPYERFSFPVVLDFFGPDISYNSLFGSDDRLARLTPAQLDEAIRDGLDLSDNEDNDFPLPFPPEPA